MGAVAAAIRKIAGNVKREVQIFFGTLMVMESRQCS
jgi:hypothetical protein